MISRKIIKYILPVFLVSLPIGCNSLKPERFEANVQEPQISSSTPANKENIYIRISKDGYIFLNDEAAGTVKDIRILERKLEQLNGVKGDQSTREFSGAVFIKATEQIEYDDVEKVIEKVKSMGFAPIGLQVDRKP